MARRDEIIAWCDELLDVGSFADYGPNGLQVPGAAEVRKLVTGVSAHLELVERAAAAGAQLVLAHHGLFWDSKPRSLSEQDARRLRAAFAADLSVAAYHLPLDAHPEIGNNALLCEALGLERSEPFGAVKGRAIGWIGRSAEGMPAAELVERLRAATGREPLTFMAGPERVRAAGIVTGAGTSTIEEAIRGRLDALVTGEPSEHAMADAREGGLHFLAAGHYATEIAGIRRLGELVAERFGVEHEFVSVPNPI